MRKRATGEVEGTALKRSQAIQLRLSGLTYRRIAEAMNTDVGTAYRYVAEVMRETAQLAGETAAELRQVELDRIDRLWEITFAVAETGDLDAVEKCRRLSESRRKLLGLDAPTKLEHGGPGGGPVLVEWGGTPPPEGDPT